MLQRIKWHLLANMVFTVAVYAAYLIWPETVSFVLKGMIPAPGPHLMISGMLALLLVFRTNSAYDRYWEGRRLWGFLYSRTRDLARLAHSVMKGKDREHFLQLVAATPPVLLQHLRSGWLANGQSPPGYNLDLETLAKELLPKEDHRALMTCTNRPFLIVKMMGAIIRKVYADANKLWAQRGTGKEPTPLDLAVLQSNLAAERQHAEMLLLGIVETIGGCERIVRTTVPRSYSRHTSRFLSVWCFTLPLIMVEAFKWRMIPIVFLLCWALFVIEEIGHIIEDPFNMLWEGGKYDELKLDKSFPGMRKETMERLPAMDPRLMTNAGDLRIVEDYDVADFHAEYIKSPTPASI